MRLSKRQIEVILETVQRHLGPQAQVLVYGSRLDDQCRGGDIDLLIRDAGAVDPLLAARIQVQLQEALSVAVDLGIIQDGECPGTFQQMVLQQAVPLRRAG